jgi:hypothetical protein
MKILRKNDDFKKMPDKTIDDALAINSLIRQGWNYCPRKVYKDFYRTEEPVKTEKPVKNTEKKKTTQK